jgi:AcrR family transcriptional regulator
MTSKVAAAHADAILHKQKRAMLTRKHLLRSARAVFARDGFEHTCIEEIAAKAGKTRGAFYDNFSGKEDVFFAIFEENLDRDMAELKSLIASLSNFERRIKALVDYLIGLTKDRERILLNVEFKLYAIRHPHKRKRLAALYETMRFRGSFPELDLLLPVGPEGNPNSKSSNSIAICGLLDGLALSHFFNPETFDAMELARYLKLCLRQTLRKRAHVPEHQDSDTGSQPKIMRM